MSVSNRYKHLKALITMAGVMASLFAAAIAGQISPLSLYGPDSPCPYNQCLRIRFHYINNTSRPELQSLTFLQSVHAKVSVNPLAYIGITAGGLSISPEINREFGVTLEDNQPKDSFVNIDNLNAQGIAEMNIKMHASSLPLSSHNCQTTLFSSDLRGDPVYLITLIADDQGLRCNHEKSTVISNIKAIAVTI